MKKYLFYVKDVKKKGHNAEKTYDVLDQPGKDGYSLVQVLDVSDNYRYFFQKEVEGN